MPELSVLAVLNVILLTLVLLTGGIIMMRTNLFSAVMLSGLYSLIMALCWVNLHALDVAFTEAAVGAGISTVLLLGAVARTEQRGRRRPLIHPPAMLLCAVVGGLMLWGSLDMPRFGDPCAPVHQTRVPALMAQDVGKMEERPGPPLGTPELHGHPDDDFAGHSPNTVTTLLASYRGYDTMFETAVILSAGLALILLLPPLRRDAGGRGGRP